MPNINGLTKLELKAFLDLLIKANDEQLNIMQKHLLAEYYKRIANTSLLNEENEIFSNESDLKRKHKKVV